MADFIKLQQDLNYTFKNIALLKQALTHRSFSKHNYERLEFVGDGILDFVVALNLYQQYPNFPEGELSKIRAALVNQNSLVEIALKINLGQYLLLENGEEKTGGRNRPSILADSVEAIFAAVFLDSDFSTAKMVIDKAYHEKLNNITRLMVKDSKSALQEYLQERQIAIPDYTVIASSGPDHDSTFRVECHIPMLQLKVIAEGKSKKEASQLAALKILHLIKENDAKS